MPGKESGKVKISMESSRNSKKTSVARGWSQGMNDREVSRGQILEGPTHLIRSSGFILNV